MTCPADSIPDIFEFSLEGLEIGRSLHISATRLPEGVEPTIKNRDFTIATVGGHRTDEEAAPAAAGAPAAEGAAPQRRALPLRPTPRLAPPRPPPKDAGGAKGGAAAKPAATSPAKGGQK